MMNFKAAEEYLVKRFEKDLDKRLHYHNLSHSQDVCQSAQRLAEIEGVPEEEMILVLTASVYHDAGFLFRYINNENYAVKFTREALPQFGYNEQEIELVCGMILATRMPQEPLTIFEKIVCDADLDYMGRDDFFMVAMKLFQEMNEFGFRMTLSEWFALQLEFVEKHRYFSHAAIALRRNKKMEHLTQIKELLCVK
ncbi:MAG: HD domain-containing protein [Bacteroidetes bacterium]|nr:HD domain-containing protein [Bacteroidota bacterium]